MQYTEEFEVPLKQNKKYNFFLFKINIVHAWLAHKP